MKAFLSVLFLLCVSPLFAEEAVKVSVSVDTPHPGYELKLIRIDRSEKGLSVLAQPVLPHPDRMYPAVIGSASATASIEGKSGPVQLYLLNRPWGWGDDPAVKTEAEYLKKIGASTPVPFEQE